MTLNLKRPAEVPRSMRAAWMAYLGRGAKEGDKVLAIEELLESGKLAQASVKRFETA